MTHTIDALNRSVFIAFDRIWHSSNQKVKPFDYDEKLIYRG